MNICTCSRSGPRFQYEHDTVPIFYCRTEVCVLCFSLLGTRFQLSAWSSGSASAAGKNNCLSFQTGQSYQLRTVKDVAICMLRSCTPGSESACWGWKLDNQSEAEPITDRLLEMWLRLHAQSWLSDLLLLARIPGCPWRFPTSLSAQWYLKVTKISHRCQHKSKILIYVGKLGYYKVTNLLNSL